MLYRRADIPLPTEYEGVIVDKTLNIQEEQTGSRIKLLLLIKGDDGKQFYVSPIPELYDRAKVGMHIKRTKDGTTLTDEKYP